MSIDVRRLANGRTSTVNANLSAVISRSTGFQVTPSYGRIPTYAVFPIDAQVQALSFSDLTQIDGLNIQGYRRALYVEGSVAAVIRGQQKGGDLVTFPPGTLFEGDTWLVVHVLEQWQFWSKFVITLQEEAAATPFLSANLNDPTNLVVVPAVLTGV